MNTNNVFLLCFVLLCAACKNSDAVISASEKTSSNFQSDYVIAFGSCADQDRAQPLWEPILQNNPNVFIWGGDNIYADTADMAKMKADYDKTKTIPAYQKLASTVPIEGTWDDHDYGKNDAGASWQYKAQAQQLLLDFFDVPRNSPRRIRDGVYYSKPLFTEKGSIKLIVLDTRYFRSDLLPSNKAGERYQPWPQEEGGTILGDAQWEWLKRELTDNGTDFTIIVSSIQFLANEHGWEKWGNHPDEVEKMNALLSNANANNILFLSGDRHHAEISKTTLEAMEYPLLDITSSGMTHTFPGTPMEKNPYRVGKWSKELNFCILHFDFENKAVKIEIRGEHNQLLETYTQHY